MTIEEDFKNFVYDDEGWSVLTDDENFLYSFIRSKYEDITDDEVFELSSCILIHLPIVEQKRALNMFINYGETLYCACTDILKLIYILWDNVPSIFEEEFKTIIAQLKEFASKENLPKRNGTRFIYWHLCGLYPLLDKEMLVTVSKRNYNDAQDSMMFGIYHLTDTSYTKRIFRGWNEAGNIDLSSSGTGCDWELKIIVDHYTKLGLIDQELLDIITN